MILPGGAGAAGTLTVTTNLTFTGNGSLGMDLGNVTTVGGGVNDLIQLMARWYCPAARPRR